jgi:lipoprotein-releasing system ATP-binding protein
MAIIASHVKKKIGGSTSEVLHDISLEIQEGEFVSLTGRSGSGKSTLLYILSGLDSPSAGNVKVSGLDFQKMESEELYHFRNQSMGFVFQSNYLIAELSAIDNVLMPTRKSKQSQIRRARAEELLEKCDLKEKLERYPRQLSGGEQQRVAVARALIMEPKYLFADEPTGSLDSANGDKIMKLILEVNSLNKTTVVLVTHDQIFAKMAQREILLVDGRIAQPISGGIW